MLIHDRYPMMRPYVGRRFEVRTKPSLLLVGESHYLPRGSSQHASAARWYSGTWRTLTRTEAEWIDTADVVESSRRNGFRDRAHVIYRSAFQAINGVGPRYDDYRRVADDIAFCNFFLRPAAYGKSLNVCAMDARIANGVLLQLIKDQRPTAVVFLSRLALWWSDLESSGCQVISTPHPGSHWWNVAAKAYGGRMGREILKQYVATLRWPRDLRNER